MTCWELMVNPDNWLNVGWFLDKVWNIRILLFDLLSIIIDKAWIVCNVIMSSLLCLYAKEYFCYFYAFIQDVTGPYRQNDRDDRPCREDHFLYSQTCRLWAMRRWMCSPVRIGIEYRQLYTCHFIEKGMFLQYVFKQSALCLIACFISSQQLSVNTAEQQVLLVQSTVVFAPKEKNQGALNQALLVATT